MDTSVDTTPAGASLLSLVANLYGGANTPSACVDSSGRILYANPALQLAWKGTITAQVTGENVLCLLAGRTPHDLSGALHAGQPWSGTFWHLLPGQACSTVVILPLGGANESASCLLLQILPSSPPHLGTEHVLDAGGATPYVMAFAESSEAALILDAEGRIEQVNRAACKVLGRHRDALQGLSMDSLLVQGDHAESDASVSRWSGTLVRDDAAQAIVTAHFRRLSDGRAICLLRPPQLAAQDTSMEIDALREQISSLRVTLDSCFEFIGLLDPQGTVLDANKTSLEFVGVSLKQVVGRPFWETPWWAHDPAMAARVRAAVLEARTGRFVRFETTHAAADGSVKYVDFSLKPLLDASGAVRFLLPEGRDFTARRTMELALRQSESQQMALLSALPDLLLVLEKDGTLIRVHAPVPSPLSVAACAAVGRDVREFAPELSPSIVDLLATVATEGTLHTTEYQCTLDGEALVLEARLTRLGMDKVLVLVRDITESRKVQSQQQASDERLRKIAAQVPGVVYEFKYWPDGRSCFPYASEGIRDIYGVTPEAVRADATAVFARLHPDDLERVRISIEASAAQLTPWICEYRTLGDDGLVQWLRGHSVPERTPDGTTVWYGFITNVTERMQAEETLRISEGRFRRYFELNLIGMATTSPTKGWLQVNDRLCSILGYTREELSTLTWAALTYPEDLDADEALFTRVIEGEIEGYDLEKRFVRKDGAIIDTTLSVKCLRNRTGDVDCFVSLVQDITERKRAEEERLIMERKLLHTQKLESLGIMAGGIAHDFNNLLTAISGNLELAQLYLLPGTPSMTLMERAEQAAHRAADLTRQMLAYSGKGHFLIRHLDLNELVSENSDLFRATAAKSVTLSLQLDPGIPEIYADPGQMQQVLMNLMTNAAEAIGERDGTVRIATGMKYFDAGMLEGSLPDLKPPPGPFIYLDVVDNGCGMDKNTRDRLFDPFFTTKFTGRGLGMSAVLGILRGHGGALFLNSAPGAGTAIRVLFPLASTSAPCASKPLPATVPDWVQDGRVRTVLVADDEAIVLQLAKSMLEHLGLVALTAIDGAEAIRMFQVDPTRIDAVVLDLSMPHIDGLATAEALLALRPDLPVVLASGYSEEDVLSRGSWVRPAVFIQKPYTFPALREALGKLFGNSPSSAE